MGVVGYILFDQLGKDGIKAYINLENIPFRVKHTTNMTFSSTLNVFVLLALISASQALPPKGCTSCLMVPIEESEKAGISSTNKTRNSETGCFVQTVQCASKVPDSDTYIQFNKGRKGLFAAVEQTIQLICNDQGQWEFRHSKLILTVNSLTCLST
eukprot:NP_001021751.1 Uncharacterized protein CELE_Y37F4.8 [Caenorhabditis elegans]